MDARVPRAVIEYPITADIIFTPTEGPVSNDANTAWSTVESLDTYLQHLIEEDDIQSALAVITDSPELTKLNSDLAVTGAKFDTATDDNETRQIVDEYTARVQAINTYQVRKP